MDAELSACWNLQRVLDGERELGNDGQQNAQMILGEGVAFAVIQRQHAHRPVQADQRHRQRAAHGGELGFVVQIARFDRRIAVDDRFAILRHPAREALAERNFERGEQAEVFAVDIFGAQLVVAQNIDRQRIVGDHALQPDRQQRQRLVQAERIAQILRQLEEVLHFLAGGGDGGQEVRRLFAGACKRAFASRIPPPAPGRARS